MRKRFIENSMNGKKRVQLLFWFAACILMVFPGKPALVSASQIQRNQLREQNSNIQYVAKRRVNISNQRSISLNADDEPLLAVLKQLAKKSRVGISYQRAMIPQKRITVHLNNVTVYQALRSILKGTQLEVILPFTKDVLVIKKKPVKLEIQKETVSGTVTDASTGEPLIGTSILEVGTSNGTTTDVNGRYSLAVSSLQDTLRFSYIGYETQAVAINDRLTVDVSLRPTAANLGQIVVTGFGQISQKQFTGSASQVSQSELEDVPVTSVTQVLQGAAPGLQLTSPSGTPGSLQQIHIRGISSINTSTQPLFVIDGVPVSSKGLNTATSSSLGVLSALNPSNIKSVTVLKGATGTALYGASGSNGVIVITTKDGRKNQETSYSVSVRRGFSNRAVPGPTLTNASQWDELYKEGLINAGQDPANIKSPWDGTTNTDWMDLVTRDPAISQDISLSASGGNEQSSFIASLNYNKKQGMNIGTDFQRVSGYLSMSYDLSSAATLSNKTTASAVKQNGQLEFSGYYGSPTYVGHVLRPGLSAYNADGTININMDTHYYNPLWIAKYDINKTQVYDLMNNTRFQLDLLDNLTFTSILGLNLIINQRKAYDNPVYGDAVDEKGRIYPGYSKNFKYTWKNTFSYDWQINEDNDVNIKVSQQAQKNQYYNARSEAMGFATMGLTNAASAGTPVSSYSYADDWAKLGVLGMVRYSFKDKYNVQASYRYSGNSRFAEGHRWGSFYAIGASWLLSDEAFLSNAKWLDLLKLRGSFGKTGNAAISLNQYQSFLSYSNSYDGRGTIEQSQLGNKSLTWEEAYSYELGVDVGLFNRITAKATAFRKNSTNLLLDVPISYATGHSSIRRNIGELYNRGIELALNIDAIQSKDVHWSFGLNYTTVENKVTKMPISANGNPIKVTTGTRYVAVQGYQYAAWYMRTWAGVDPENGQPLWYKNKVDGNGNIIGRTTTSNYNEADRYYQGASAFPTEFGSITTHFSFKGIFLDANLYYSFGNKVYDSYRHYLVSDGESNKARNQMLIEYTSHWKKPGDHVRNPQFIDGGNLNAGETSSRWLFNDNYLRLKTLRIGYNFSSSLLSKLRIGLSALSIYFTGRNLWTYTYSDYLYWDPEVQQSGFIEMSQSPMKTFSFGIKAKF